MSKSIAQLAEELNSSFNSEVSYTIKPNISIRVEGKIEVKKGIIARDVFFSSSLRQEGNTIFIEEIDILHWDSVETRGVADLTKFAKYLVSIGLLSDSDMDKLKDTAIFGSDMLVGLIEKEAVRLTEAYFIDCVELSSYCYKERERIITPIKEFLR